MAPLQRNTSSQIVLIAIGDRVSGGREINGNKEKIFIFIF